MSKKGEPDSAKANKSRLNKRVFWLQPFYPIFISLLFSVSFLVVIDVSTVVPFKLHPLFSHLHSPYRQTVSILKYSHIHQLQSLFPSHTSPTISTVSAQLIYLFICAAMSDVQHIQTALTVAHLFFTVRIVCFRDMSFNTDHRDNQHETLYMLVDQSQSKVCLSAPHIKHTSHLNRILTYSNMYSTHQHTYALTYNQ